MVTTRVTWAYSTAEYTQSVTDELDANNTTLPEELDAKAVELGHLGGSAPGTLTVEEDIPNQKVKHIRTRQWPTQEAAEQWVTFVLLKGAESAVVVEE
jgi:hypothetical protein